MFLNLQQHIDAVRSVSNTKTILLKAWGFDATARI